MMYLTDADKEKLALLDDIFRTVPVDVIRRLSEADRIVEVLKDGGAAKPNGVIVQMVEENNRLNVQLVQMQSDVMMLRANLQTITRIMARPQYDYQNSSDFVSLKNSLGVY